MKEMKTADGSPQFLCACCLAKNPSNSHSLLRYADLLKKCLKIKVISPINESIVCSTCVRLLKRLKKFRDQVKAAQGFIKTLKHVYESCETTNTNSMLGVIVKEEYKEPMQVNGHNDYGRSCPATPTPEEVGFTDIVNCVKEEKTEQKKELHCDVVRVEQTKSEQRLPYRLDRTSRTCPVCEQSFVFFKELTDHMPTHYPSYICDICGRLCATRLSLKNHIKSHYEPTNKCNECGKRYKKSSSLREHTETAHNGQKRRYKCPECSETFVTFHGRVVHLISTHGHEDKRYKCKECPKRYNHGSHLRAHIRNEHRKEKNAQCEVCHSMFFNKSALRKHLVSHSQEKRHQCAYCTKFFPRKSSLNQHLKIHTNDRSFVCPVCGRAFTQKVSLNKHTLTHEKSDRSVVKNCLSSLLKNI